MKIINYGILSISLMSFIVVGMHDKKTVKSLTKVKALEKEYQHNISKALLEEDVDKFCLKIEYKEKLQQLAKENELKHELG